MGKPIHAGREILSYEEVKHIIDVAPELKYKALFAMLYITGARVSELTNRYSFKYDKERKRYVVKGVIQGLKKSHITVVDDEVSILLPLLKKRKSMVKNEHILVFSKETPFMDIILSYIARLSEDSPVFNFTRQTAWNHLKKGSETGWLHLFRHTRLSKLARMGASPEDLRQWAGHADYKQLKHYLAMVPMKKFKDVIR